MNHPVQIPNEPPLRARSLGTVPVALPEERHGNRRAPRVVFVNRSYYPDAEATGQLLTELCADLTADFDVAVVAGQPNQNPLQAPYRKWGRETHEGVTIHRVWNTRFPKRWLPARLTNLLSYLALATTTSLTLGRRYRPDVIVVETDPPALCLLGALARRRYGCKLVVYLQDIYPDLAVALGKLRNGAFTRWLRRLFFAVYRHADQVIVLSDDMRKVLTDAGIDERKIAIIPNWMDCQRVVPQKVDNRFRKSHSLERHFVVMYSGNMGLCQGLENLLDAAERLQPRQDVVFMFVGDGSLRPALQRMTTDRKLKNVRFVNYQPATQLADSLSAADVHLVPLDPRVSNYIMPSKLYGVLASGTPVIAVAPSDCELSRLVVQEEVGYVVDPAQPDKLASLLGRLADDPRLLAPLGERARQLALRRFDRSISRQKFSALLENVLRGK